MTLRVLDPGLYTLVVDQGRPNCRSLGVPVGGAADRTALALGNALVGNPPDAAALEISLTGPTLRAECPLACVVYGAPFQLSGNRRLSAGKTFTLQAGEELEVGPTVRGMRAYLCVRGGLQEPLVLGSRSALAPVKAGQELPCLPGAIQARYLGAALPRLLTRAQTSGGAGPTPIRVLAGLQAGWFPVLDVLAAGTDGGVPPPVFTVSPASNRMGLRLQGPPLPVPARELVSEPVCPGAVQVTRDGQCIILGVDGQTIGGYPKIAQVISADLDELAQLRPGDAVAFVAVSLEEATTLYRQKQAELRRWVTRLSTAEVFVP
jgi:antagonist of KipI